MSTTIHVIFNSYNNKIVYGNSSLKETEMYFENYYEDDKGFSIKHYEMGVEVFDVEVSEV